MTAPPRRFLMVHWDGAGNLPPQRALARQLVRRGHEVHVLSHDSVADRARCDGATFHRLATAHQYKDSDDLGDGLDELRFLAETCWTAPAYADDFLAVANEVRPDVLLIDNVLFSVLAAASNLELPTVALGHSIYEPARIEVIAQLIDPSLGETIERAYAFVATLPLILIPSYAAFNARPDRGPAVRHVGPIREIVEARPSPRRYPERPFVLVSLSTSFQRQAETLQRICDALATLKVEALITTGPNMPPERFDAADHVELRAFVPHDEVLPSADLVITHCGHGTVMAAAGAGVPMLCLPMGRDQPFVAERAEALGLGLAMVPTSSPGEIAAIVEGMLAEPNWRAAAKAFAEGVPRFGELERATQLVEQVQ